MPRLDATRRAFLRRSAIVGAAVAPPALPLALSLFGSGAAVSQMADYRALVCLFMNGGNDSANMVLPTDTASWQAYQTYRGTLPEPIALQAAGTAPLADARPGTSAALGGVLQIAPDTFPGDPNAGRPFALHPLMVDAARLFDAGRLAVVANVGPLTMPLTRSEYLTRARAIPARLFSHNDQVSTWQALAPDGARVGWGGMLADRVAGLNDNVVFTSVSAAGRAVFLSGDSTFQYQVGPQGGVAISGLSGPLFGSDAAAASLRAVLHDPATHLLAREHARIVQRSIAAQAGFQAAFAAAAAPVPSSYRHPVLGTLQANSLATQLQTVARIIDARAGLGVRRQVFYVNLAGFDTHDDQNRRHADLMARVSHALGYFDEAMGALGLREQVTLFTASDFGRAFTSNGDGTDHGWGGHHLVLGGQVMGRRIHGRFPAVGLDHDEDAYSGSLLPAVAVDQYAATLGRWFGVTDADLDAVFPNLRNFASRDLGFMRAA